MSPDFRPQIPNTDAEPAPALGEPTAAVNPEDAPVDERLEVAVTDLLERLGGRVLMWHIVYELYGHKERLPKPVYEELTEGLSKLVDAGLVVNIARRLFVTPEKAAELRLAEQERSRDEQRRSRHQGRIDNDDSPEPNQPDTDTADVVETPPAQRHHRQTSAEVEAMMKGAFEDLPSGPYSPGVKQLSTGRNRRRH